MTSVVRYDWGTTTSTNSNGLLTIVSGNVLQNIGMSCSDTNASYCLGNLLHGIGNLLLRFVQFSAALNQLPPKSLVFTIQPLVLTLQSTRICL